MSKPKWTPGPWFVGTMNDALFVIDKPPFPASDPQVRDVPGVTVIAKFEAREEANAHLIAAAPDIYAALMAVLVMWDHGPCPKKFDEALSWRENDEQVREMARAALAKAKGEAA